jgi:hypothetical protein
LREEGARGIGDLDDQQPARLRALTNETHMFGKQGIKVTGDPVRGVAF